MLLGLSWLTPTCPSFYDPEQRQLLQGFEASWGMHLSGLSLCTCISILPQVNAGQKTIPLDCLSGAF
jgi:hypothetical protein